jgi:cold shock CspA family protein
MKGKVGRLFQDKGYGFIKDENGESRFFHISNIKGFDEIFEGAIVKFKPNQNSKGLQATEITLLNNNKKSFISFGDTNIRLNNIKNYGIDYVNEVKVTKETKNYTTGEKIFNRTLGVFSIITGVAEGSAGLATNGINSFSNSYYVENKKYIKHRVLYITTYQGDNFRFQENKVDFDIIEKFNTLNDYLSL